MSNPGHYAPERLDEQPALIFPRYTSTISRNPKSPLIELPAGAAETTGPSDWAQLMGPAQDDLTKQHRGAPQGQRIIVHGRVMDENSRPVQQTILEIWQANAAGRYVHKKDQWDAPLDPNFTGAGRLITDAEGRYRFTTVRPGAYPWSNHFNAWRPAHIHFSLLGPAFITRLVTQMYFPDDPLVDIDPIANAVPMPYRQRLVSRFDIGATMPNFALGYRFDIVLRGIDATPMEAENAG